MPIAVGLEARPCLCSSLLLVWCVNDVPIRLRSVCIAHSTPQEGDTTRPLRFSALSRLMTDA